MMHLRWGCCRAVGLATRQEGRGLRALAVLGFTALAFASLAAGPASAALITYQDRSAFDAAINDAPLSWQGFNWLDGRQSAPLGLGGGASVSTDSGTIWGSWLTIRTVSGRRSIDWWPGFDGNISFSFANPINAFSIQVKDLGGLSPSTLRVSIDGGDFFDLITDHSGPRGNLLFFGLFDDDAFFRSVTFAITNPDEAVGLDNLRFGQVAVTALPEPASLALFGFGLAGLIILFRRRSRRAQSSLA